MSPAKSQPDLGRLKTAPAVAPSRALEWLWQYLRDDPAPQIMDCGPVFQATLNVLLKRGAKIHIGDILTPLPPDNPTLWSREGKKVVFREKEFLNTIPSVFSQSLSVIFAWHLLDLVPHEALPALVERLVSFLRPGGVLFCLLREPYLPAGAGISWWLESLTIMRPTTDDQRPFPYPAVTNREMERLVPGGNVKTFLTRTGRREVLGVK
jgi:hypothetical protein